MKNGLVLATVITVVIILHSFRVSQTGSITGSVTPAEGALSIVSIQANDTIKVSPVNGQFNFSVKPGVWKLIVDAKDPYKDVTLENIEVNDGKETNLGEIRLQH